MRSKKRFNTTTTIYVTLRDLNYQKIPRPDLDREVVNVAAMIVLEADLVILTSTVECHVKLQIIPFMMISVNPEGIMSPGIIKTVVDTGLEIVGVKILEAVVEVEGWIPMLDVQSSLIATWMH